MDDLVALWLRPPNVFWTRPRWSRKSQKTSARLMASFFTGDFYVFFEVLWLCLQGQEQGHKCHPSSENHCQGKGCRETGFSWRFRELWIIMDSSFKYYPKDTQKITKNNTMYPNGLLLNWCSFFGDHSLCLIPGYNSMWCEVLFVGPHAVTREGKMKNIERFKQEIAIMKMMDWQGWTAGDTKKVTVDPKNVTKHWCHTLW